MPSLIHLKRDDRARQNLRLSPELWAAIDAARERRAGNISRNTWITEALEEKLGREAESALKRQPTLLTGGSRV